MSAVCHKQTVINTVKHTSGHQEAEHDHTCCCHSGGFLPADEKEASAQWDIDYSNNFGPASSMFCASLQTLLSAVNPGATSLFSQSVTSPLGDIMLWWVKHPLVHAQSTPTLCRIHKNLGISVSQYAFSALHFSKGVNILSFQKGTWPSMHLRYNVNYY